MNKLEQVVYSNLDRHPERNWYMLGMLTGMGASLDQIVRLRAKDALEYQDVASISEAAISDGFDFFDRYLAEEHKTNLAWFWTYCRSLRYIIESKKTTLLMIDDFTLRQTFWKIRDLVGSIEEPLKILQIECWFPHEVDGMNFYKLVPPRHMRNYNNDLFRGLWGAGDSCIVYSPEGAALMLDWISEGRCREPETVIYQHSETEVPGCFVVRCSWEWIGHCDQTVFEQARDHFSNRK